MVYKLSKEEADGQRETLMKLKEHEWILMTRSPFAAPEDVADERARAEDWLLGLAIEAPHTVRKLHAFPMFEKHFSNFQFFC